MKRGNENRGIFFPEFRKNKKRVFGKEVRKYGRIAYSR